MTEALIVAAVVGVVFVGGGGTGAHAALSPTPYLDTIYNDTLWTELLTETWPTGTLNSGFYPNAYIGASWAGTLAPLAKAIYPLTLSSSGTWSAGLKIVRSSDTQWVQLSGNIGTAYTSSSVQGEAWCKAGSGTCGSLSNLNAASPTSAGLVNDHDLYLRPQVAAFTDCRGNNWSWMDGIALSGSFTGQHISSCETRILNALQAETTAINAIGVGTTVTLTGSNCSSEASGWLSGYGDGSATFSGTCSVRVWREAANVAALVSSLPQPYTNQPWSLTVSITTPSESTALSNFRNWVPTQPCSLQNVYNHSLDQTNWAGPEPNNGPCGGPIETSRPQTYGPGGGPAVHGCWINPPIGKFVPAAHNPTCMQGEPVDLATGSYYTSTVDLSLPGIGIPFTFERSYNSQDTSSGPLGVGWTDNLNWTISGTSTNLTLRTGTGQQLHWGTSNYLGQYIADPGTTSVETGSFSSGFTVTTSDQSTYTFNGSGQLTSIVDRNGKGLALAYDGGGNLTSVTDSAGRVITFTTSGGLITKITLPDGRSVSYGYTSGLLTSFTDLRGGTTSYTYDANNELATITDQNGHHVISNTYDPSTGRVTQQVDARGHTSTYGWNPTTGTATYTDPNGRAWTQTYVNNTLRSMTDPLGNTTTFTYDGDLNPIAIKDARGNTTTMTWGANGNMMSRTAPAPLSYTESWTYDSKDDVTSYTDGRGHTSTYGYDGNGNLTSVTLPNPTGSGAGPTTTYGRDPITGLVTSMTDPRGKTTTFGYDSAGDLTSVTSALGYETTYGYDAAGRMISKVDPRGNVTGANPADYTWTYAYDDANHLISQTDPLGDETQWSYDPVGNLHSLADANNNTQTYSYDNANDLTTVTAPDTTVTAYTYDNNGNLASRTDANNHTTTYSYDNANDLTSMVKPDGETWTYTYDADHNLAGMVDGNGNATHSGGTTTYGYDGLNRLTSISYSGTVTPNVTFTYDGDGNRTTMTDGGGTVNYSYDNDNRLTGVTRGSQSFSYAYDANSNLTSETYPNSTSIAYTYTDDEQLASVASAGNTTSYSYDQTGNVLTTTLPSGDGYVETDTYDRAGRLVNVSNVGTSGTLSAFAYTLDPAGNPTEIDQTGATASTITYGYDTVNRLTSATVGGATTSWTYDGVGNRLTQTSPLGTTSFSYNADNELTAAGSTSYSYDANGNQLTAGATTSTYDVANRLISTTVGSVTYAYAYDGDGNRSSAGDGGSTTKYFWDPGVGIPQLAIEQDGSGANLRTYLYGNRLISMTTGGASPTTYYEHYDGLGSVVDLTDATGSVQWSYVYDPWGNSTATSYGGGAPENPIQFAGEYVDPSGLDHIGARQYDPLTGRFTSLDSARPTAPSTYLYVDDKPTTSIDPTGRDLINWIGGNLASLGNEAWNTARTFANTAWDTAGDLVRATGAAVGDVGQVLMKVGGCIAHNAVDLGIGGTALVLGVAAGVGGTLATAACVYYTDFLGTFHCITFVGGMTLITTTSLLSLSGYEFNRVYERARYGR